MMLHPLVSRVGENNMRIVREVEKIEKIRGVERIKKVKGVGEAIGEIR